MTATSKLKRPYISSRFVLELDDGGGPPQFVGTLQTIEGGGFKSDVVEEKVGSQPGVMKYSGRPKYDEVTVQVGMAMAPRFWKWISKSFSYEAERHNGALVALDFDNCERWRRTFSNALIKEVTFPTLDGAAKEPAYMSVKFAVEDLKEETGRRGNKHDAEREANGEWDKQRLWLPSMFTFRVDGLTGDQAETCKIESFTVKQEIIDVPTGGRLVNNKEPGRVDFPPLAVSILQRDADPWMKWWDEFVRQGHHEQSKQKNGHISFLKRTAQGPGILTGEPLLTLDLYGIGILGVSPVKHESKQIQLQKVRLDMYVESMELKPGPGTV
jgi:phage tail-like protein